jgi:ribosome biogenesis GTPase
VSEPFDSPFEAGPALARLGFRRYAAQVDLPDTVSSGMLGRVRRVDRGEVDVVTAAGEVRAVSDRQRAQSAIAPATGDWVVVVDDPDVGWRIETVLPRSAALVRRDPSEREIDQVLVANVDLVGVVAGVDRPPNVARIERFLVLAEDSGADAVVVLTKTDLCLDAEWETALEQIADLTVLHTSTVSGRGLDELHRLIADDHTLVLLGESGAGKSTLVNALLDDEVQATKDVRAGDAKGRHTTTAREMLTVPGGGVLIDTPGMRGVGLWNAESAVAAVFADVTDMAGSCRFSDCRHVSEPDCAVKTAVEAGLIDPLRLQRYLRLRAELDDQAVRLEQQRRRPQGRRR